MYIAEVNDEICGIISILPFPHPKIKKQKRVHRLVVLPEYQGIGIGLRLLNWAGGIVKSGGYTLNIVTSNPSLYRGLLKSDEWALMRKGRMTAQSDNNMKTTSSINRITASFRYK